MAGGLIDDTIDHKPAAYRPEVKEMPAVVLPPHRFIFSFGQRPDESRGKTVTAVFLSSLAISSALEKRNAADDLLAKELFFMTSGRFLNNLSARSLKKKRSQSSFERSWAGGRDELALRANFERNLRHRWRLFGKIFPFS
jgi:hypothetical protein